MLATTCDIDGVLQLYMECLNVPQQDYYNTKDSIEKFLFEHLGRDVFISCIMQDDKVVSMAVLSVGIHAPDSTIYSYNGKFGILKNIYTSPEYRNRRFASGCINELICFAGDNHVRYIFANTGPSSILNALQFSKANDNTYMIDMNGV